MTSSSVELFAYNAADIERRATAKFVNSSGDTNKFNSSGNSLRPAFNPSIPLTRGQTFGLTIRPIEQRTSGSSSESKEIKPIEIDF